MRILKVNGRRDKWNLMMRICLLKRIVSEREPFVFSALIVLCTKFQSQQSPCDDWPSMSILYYFFLLLLIFVHFVMNHAEYNLPHWDAIVNNHGNLLLQGRLAKLLHFKGCVESIGPLSIRLNRRSCETNNHHQPSPSNKWITNYPSWNGRCVCVCILMRLLVSQCLSVLSPRVMPCHRPIYEKLTIQRKHIRKQSTNRMQMI